MSGLELIEPQIKKAVTSLFNFIWENKIKLELEPIVAAEQ
jgi:hypothetical protein